MFGHPVTLYLATYYKRQAKGVQHAMRNNLAMSAICCVEMLSLLGRECIFNSCTRLPNSRAAFQRKRLLVFSTAHETATLFACTCNTFWSGFECNNYNALWKLNNCMRMALIFFLCSITTHLKMFCLCYWFKWRLVVRTRFVTVPQIT